MAKISSYESDNNISGGDKVIGTDADSSNATKNYEMSDIAAYVAGTIPSPTLQSVLTAGNTATESINLTGTATVTTLTAINVGANGVTCSTLGSTTVNNAGQVNTVSFSIVGQFLDRNGLSGTAGQVLVSEGGGVVWQDPVGALGQVSVTVPSADFNLLNTTPYPLIPAPGAGKAIQVISGSLKMVYGSSPYSFQATGVEIEVTPGNPQIFITNSNVNVVADTFVTLTPVSSGAIAEDSSVQLSAPAAQLGTQGDSDVKIDLLYRIITV